MSGTHIFQGEGTSISGTTSTVNSSTVALAAGASFTGDWENVERYSSLTVAAKTDQDGTFSIQFSPDGVNQDSTLTRYYRTAQIEAPHRFTITRKYARIVFTNTSASLQSFFRLQTLFGLKGDLNAPLDSTLSQDFDSIATRPSDYNTEVALGRRQGHTLWNKFGYNTDVGTSAEVFASWGGTFTPMTTARTLSVVSTDANDTGAGTGAQGVVIYGIDANRREQVVVLPLTGLTPAVTTETWLGIDRMVVYTAGTAMVNLGTITATATVDLTIQGQIPATDGTSQQCIYHIQEGHQALAEWITVNVIRFGSGTEPTVTVKGYVWSSVSNARYEVFRQTVDVGISNGFELKPPMPFPITESSVFWMEVVSTRAATSVSGRFSLIEVRDADA